MIIRLAPMHKIHLLLVCTAAFTLMLFATSSCSLPGEPPPLKPTAADTLRGRWSLIMMTGGFSGDTSYPRDGISRVDEFTEDGWYGLYENEVLKHSAGYTLATETSVLTQDTLLMITYDNGWKQSVRFLTVDSLVLSDEAYDGLTWHYSRAW
jgi:hypothetical protein